MSANTRERAIDLIDAARNILLDHDEKTDFEATRIMVDQKLREAEFVLANDG